jgi:hypothetical protein
MLSIAERTSAIFTLIMADLGGRTGHVDAFEPYPAIAAKLAKTIEVNGFLGGRPCTRLPWGAPAEKRSSRSRRMNPEAYLSPPSGASGGTLPRPSRSCDSTSFRRRYDRSDQIDVEGAEENVWAGMRGILDSGAPLPSSWEFAAVRYGDPGGFLDTIMSSGFSSGPYRL